VVTLKPSEQNATITDIAELVERLRRIESQLSTTR
jgi:hypothetical protein